MAEKTTVEFVDDIDNEQTAEFPNTTFSLDGVHYEIDLSAKNRERLLKSIEEFVEHARRTGGRKRTPVAHAFQLPTADPAESKAKREWLRANGWELADRGRIPRDAEEAWRNRSKATAKATANGGGGTRRRVAKAKVSA